MLISCKIGKEQSIHSQLSQIPEIKNCLITFGNYDIVAEFECDKLKNSKIKRHS
jgi:uncharacterized protein with GYD domain